MTSDAKGFIAGYLAQSIEVLQTFAADQAQTALLDDMAALVATAMRAGGKLLIAGNGGSAGDAQHIAAEFTARMLYDRDPLPAIALTTDTSALTAIGNDYGFEHVFERQVIGLGRRGDVFLGLSTSGTSPSILRAFGAARAINMTTIGFTGARGGALVADADLLLRAPSAFTPVIQQVHLVAGHVLCCLVERAMFPKAAAPTNDPSPAASTLAGQ